jgi:hypothetical protein
VSYNLVTVQGGDIFRCHGSEGLADFPALKHNKKEFIVIVPIFPPNVVGDDALKSAQPGLNTNLHMLGSSYKIDMVEYLR